MAQVVQQQYVAISWFEAFVKQEGLTLKTDSESNEPEPIEVAPPKDRDCTERTLAHKELIALLDEVVARFQPDMPPFDAKTMAMNLMLRMSGLELNLCRPRLDEAELFCLEAFVPDDWRRFEAVLSALGGPGLAYVEVEASTLPKVLDGLHGLSNLDALSVWAPDQGGELDFGSLKGATGPLRINILGSPASPLTVRAAQSAIVEAREWSNPALQNSVLMTKNSFGFVNRVIKPLPLAHPPQPIDFSEKQSKFDDVEIGVKVLMRSARFDDSGRFGIDLQQLSPQQVQSLRELGGEVWRRVQEDAKEAGLKISWLDLPDNFVLNSQVVSGLKQLSHLQSLSVATPAKGQLLALGFFQGRQLREVTVRCLTPKKWAVIVPEGVKVSATAPAHVTDPALWQSRVIYQRGSSPVGEAALFPSSVTKV